MSGTTELEKIGTVDYVVVKTQWRFLNYCNASSQRNNLIKFTHYDVSKKRAHDPQLVRATENPKLSYGVPSQGQASGTNQRIKALRQGGHGV